MDSKVLPGPGLLLEALPGVKLAAHVVALVLQYVVDDLFLQVLLQVLYLGVVLLANRHPELKAEVDEGKVLLSLVDSDAGHRVLDVRHVA